MKLVLTALIFIGVKEDIKMKKPYWKYLDRIQRITEMYLDSRSPIDTVVRVDFFMEKLIIVY